MTMGQPLSTEELMRLSAESDARVVPTQGPLPKDDFGSVIRGLAYFGRVSEHEERLKLERSFRRP